MHVPLTEVILSHAGAELARATLPPGEYVIGREPGVELHADTPLLSRQHARLTINYDHLLLEDLASSNGTFVNDQPVTEPTRLFPNQSIRLGPDIVLEVRRQRAPSGPGISHAPAQAAIRRHLPEEVLAGKRYAIGGIVARGGMGAILDARQTAIDRTVAMKVMLDTGDEADVLRFIDEAKITGQLDHPNIVPIYELGVDEQDQLFYTMKMVRGITLKKVLELLAAGTAATEKKFPLPVLLTVFQKVCDALAFAHSKGVIHRDLKPENLMLGDFGLVLLMDWGLAKVIGQKDAPGVDVTRSAVMSARTAEPELSGTLAGAIMGTPAYMSPEQARGEIEMLDARSDIYALGAILFEILHLRPAYTGTAAMEIVDKVARGAVAWDAKKNARLPDSLLAIIRKALALAPAARYPSVEALQRDLTAYQTGFATSAEKAGLGKQLVLLIKRHKALFSTAAAAWLVITALAGWFVVKITHERNVATHERDRANDTLGRLRGTAPTFFAQAQALIDKQQFADALEKIAYAIELNPAEADYHYLKGNLLEDLSRLAEARAAYTEALQRNPAHAFARENLNLCTELLREEAGHAGLSKASVNKLNLLMRQQGRAAEAIATVRVLGKDRQALYDTWKMVFAKAGWPRPTEKLILDDDGLFQVSLYHEKVDDISFLHGMPVKSLNLSDTKVSNLRPLEGAPLRTLNLTKTAVTDLSPLRGMKLTDLNLRETKVTDLSPLQGMPLERLILWEAQGITDLSALRGMLLKVLDLNGTNVTAIGALQGMPLSKLELRTRPGISDHSALKGMRLTKFTTMRFRDSDLALLKGMPIESLDISDTAVSDLRPLQGMTLKRLVINATRITDLSPLAGMKLTEIIMYSLPITDLSPLRGQPIEYAWIEGIPATDFSAVATWPLSDAFDAADTKFSDLRLLAGKPVKGLDLTNTPVSDISPLRGMPIRRLYLRGTKVTDLHPVADLPDLEELAIPAEATDIEFLRHLPNLQRLDNHRGAPHYAPRPAADFWREYDAQQAAGKK